jgi:hypothetical protein
MRSDGNMSNNLNSNINDFVNKINNVSQLNVNDCLNQNIVHKKSRINFVQGNANPNTMKNITYNNNIHKTNNNSNIKFINIPSSNIKKAHIPTTLKINTTHIPTS